MAEKSPKLRLPPRTPDNTVAELLADDVILLQRAGELRYMTKATLRAAVPSAPAVMQPYTQQRHDPSGPILTASVQPPSGVTLVNPNSNIAWLDFGKAAGKNLNSRQLIDQHFFYRSIFGDRNNPLAQDGRNLSNFKSCYMDYSEYLSDGVTPDDRNLMVLHDYGLELLMRRTMALSSDLSIPLEQAFLRLALAILPGDYIEIDATWTNGLLLWAALWLFPGLEPIGGGNNRFFTRKAIEIDIADQYPPGDGYAGSRYLINGTPVFPNGDAAAIAAYDANRDEFMARGPDYTAQGDGYGGSGVLPFGTSSAKDPTTGRHKYGLAFQDAQTLLFLVDGEPIRKRKITYLPTYSDTVYQDGSADFWNYQGGQPPPSNLLGQPLPMHLMISPQGVCNFRSEATSLFDARIAANQPIRESMTVHSIGVWRSRITKDAPVTTLVSTPAVQFGGVEFTRFNLGSATVSTQDGTLVFTAPSQVGTNVRALFTPLLSGSRVYTARINRRHPSVDFINLGLVLGKNGVENLTTFLVMWPHGDRAFTVVNHLMNANGGAGSGDYVAGDRFFGRTPHSFCMRIKHDLAAGTFTFLGSPDGGENTFEVVNVQTAVTLGNPDKVGFFIDAHKVQGASEPVTLNALSWTSPVSTDAQAAA